MATIETDDPDALGTLLRAIEPHAPSPRPASFSAVGPKREVMRLALRELHRAAPTPIDVVALPDGAPFGAVEINVAGCTLCLACVSACPTGALGDDPERPLLRFAEDACVQCGLCKATCPEKVISLMPRLDFRAATASSRMLKEEEPFHCIRCGKPFGVKSTIERVTAKLAGQHWMYAARLEAARRAQDVRGLPRRRRDGGGFRSPRRAAAPARAHHRRLLARARGAASGPRRTRRSAFHCVAFCRNFTSASRSAAAPIFCSGIFVPGVKVAGPSSNSFATVSGDHTMSRFLSAGEKL